MLLQKGTEVMIVVKVLLLTFDLLYTSKPFPFLYHYLKDICINTSMVCHADTQLFSA